MVGAPIDLFGHPAAERRFFELIKGISAALPSDDCLLFELHAAKRLPLDWLQRLNVIILWPDGRSLQGAVAKLSNYAEGAHVLWTEKLVPHAEGARADFSLASVRIQAPSGRSFVQPLKELLDAETQPPSPAN